MAEAENAERGDAEPGSADGGALDATAALLAELAELGLTVAVAESLTAGALTAELTRPAGASAVVLGGIVVYATELKHSLLGVDAALLESCGPVHPEVARQLADGVRVRLTVADRGADFGLATTGVAGPASQGGQAPGTVYIGVAGPRGTRVVPLALSGTREAIRAATVARAVAELAEEVAATTRLGPGTAWRE